MTRTRKTLLAVVLPLLAAAAPVGGIAITAAVENGCAVTQPIVNTLPPLSACIASVALSDIVEAIQNPLQLIQTIISSCAAFGSATVDAIVQVIESLLAGQPASSGLSVVQIARLNKVHAAAISQQHVVVPAAVPPVSHQSADAAAQ